MTAIPNPPATGSACAPDDRNATAAIPVLRIGPAEVHVLTEASCVDAIVSALDAGRGGVVVTHNLDHVRRLDRDPAFRDLCAIADLRTADGMPLVWASRLMGRPLPERVAGSDLVWSLSRAVARRGGSVFLLGGDPGTADAAARRLAEDLPGLRVCGTLCPEPGFEDRPEEMAAMRRLVREARPDVVYVALGSPKQERLIAAIRGETPGAWWLGVGISFSFVCGEVSRAPAWMRRTGLEWAHRLAQEPRRLARRYLVDGPPFALRLLASSALERWRTRPVDSATPRPG